MPSLSSLLRESLLTVLSLHPFRAPPYLVRPSICREGGEEQRRMHPAVAAAVGAAGGAAMNVRAVARASFILGLAMAAMALVAATINPGDFHTLIIEEASPAPAPAPGAQQCAATEAEALELRGMALSLVLTGVAQAVVAAAADVALVGSLRVVGVCLTAAAHLIGATNVCFLCYVVNRVALVVIGHCAGVYLGGLIVGYIVIPVSYVALLGVSLAVTFS